MVTPLTYFWTGGDRCFNVSDSGPKIVLLRISKNMSRVQPNIVQILENYKVDITLNGNIQCN